METQNLLVEVKEGVAVLTINRPSAMNALNAAVVGELLGQLKTLASDGNVKAVVITGSGNKAFVAGADISEMAEMTVQQALAFARTGQSLVNFIGSMAKPVIAAVNGYALGGGLELALACDFAYAADTAKLGLPEVTLGVIPGFGGTQKLGRLLGRPRANELIFSGKMLTAAEAKEWGIVNAIFPAEELLQRVVETAQKIIGNGLVAVSHAKEAIRTSLDMSEAEGFGHEALHFAALFSTADQKEGMRAFLEKRKAAFKGA